LRQTEGGKDELVALITSLEPSRLDAAKFFGQREKKLPVRVKTCNYLAFNKF
jgi:hypothetical protein